MAARMVVLDRPRSGGDSPAGFGQPSAPAQQSHSEPHQMHPNQPDEDLHCHIPSPYGVSGVASVGVRPTPAVSSPGPLPGRRVREAADLVCENLSRKTRIILLMTGRSGNHSGELAPASRATELQSL